MPLPNLKVVQLTLTNRCQCSCRHCGVSGLRQEVEGELSLPQIHAILRELQQSGCQVIDLFGGEPTLRTDLGEIIAAAKACGFMVSLETNGWLLDSAYISRLEAAGLDQIYLSLDDFRAKEHDRQRGKTGCFDRALRALQAGARTRMLMHVSLVPRSREFFTSGDINRFMDFVLAHGAKQVRLLLPRFVGDSTSMAAGALGSGAERELFAHIEPRFAGYLYVHTPGTPLGETNVCTAKHVFCHIMSNGWVTPCPYFPLVFGDVTREPLVDVFERMQAHPLVRLGGEFCPMRNEEYLAQHLNKVLQGRPFQQIRVENQIDLGAPCRERCPPCPYGSAAAHRPLAEVLRELATLDPASTHVEFFGGDALQHPDISAILAAVPAALTLSLWTSCRQGKDAGDIWRQLPLRRIRAVKLLLPLDAVNGVAVAAQQQLWADGLQTIETLVANDMPVHLYLPLAAMPAPDAAEAKRLLASGVERIYGCARDADTPIANAVACFGRELGRVRLLWVQSPGRPLGGAS